MFCGGVISSPSWASAWNSGLVFGSLKVRKAAANYRGRFPYAPIVLNTRGSSCPCLFLQYSRALFNHYLLCHSDIQNQTEETILFAQDDCAVFTLVPRILASQGHCCYRSLLLPSAWRGGSLLKPTLQGVQVAARNGMAGRCLQSVPGVPGGSE